MSIYLKVLKEEAREFMFKNEKTNFKAIIMSIIIVILLGAIGVVSKNVLATKSTINYNVQNDGSVDIDNSIQVESGFGEVESIEISELYYEGGQPKVKRKSIIEDTITLEDIISPFSKKVELLNQAYCAIVYNDMTINKKDGTKEEYDLLIGDKYVIIYSGGVTYRIEDQEAVTSFGKYFNEAMENNNKN